MKLEFLTQDDPLYIFPFFEEFLSHYAAGFEITQVSLCRVMGKRVRSKLLRELWHLYRPVGFIRVFSSVAAARLLGLLPKNRQAKRFYSLPQLCSAYGIACSRIANPNATGYMQGVRERAPDLIVSVACPYILKEAVLRIPRLGCINIHHAPLPRYKGMMPTFWQMYHGEKSVGLTIHYMAAKVDEGGALFLGALEIRPGESLHDLIRRSKRHGAHCMAHVLREIAAGTQTLKAHKGEKGSYFTFPAISQIQEFRRRGLRVI